MPRPVLDAMTGHLRREAEIGGYEAAAEAAEALDGVYASVARLIGAEPRRDRADGERHRRLADGLLCACRHLPPR